MNQIGELNTKNTNFIAENQELDGELTKANQENEVLKKQAELDKSSMRELSDSLKKQGNDFSEEKRVLNLKLKH